MGIQGCRCLCYDITSPRFGKYESPTPCQAVACRMQDDVLTDFQTHFPLVKVRALHKACLAVLKVRIFFPSFFNWILLSP